MRRDNITRREALGALGAVTAFATLSPTSALAHDDLHGAPRAGRLKQSVSRWCYGRMPLDDLCEAAKAIGYRSVELLSENEWTVPAKHGLACAMANGFGHDPGGIQPPRQSRQARCRRRANDSARRRGRRAEHRRL